MASVAVMGSLIHADNEVNLVTVSHRNRYSPRNKRLTQTRTMRVSGELIYPDTTTIVQHASSVFAAYVDGNDFTYTVGGVLAHRLSGGDSLSGVKVIDKNFPSGNPDELCTVRTFNATLQATYDVCEENVVQWTDNIKVIGNGGPIKHLVDTIFGPFFFISSPTSAVHVRQYGSAIGFYGPPNPPPSIDPYSEFEHLREITTTSGIQQGTGIRFYRIAWSYQYAFGSIHNAIPVSI